MDEEEKWIAAKIRKQREFDISLEDEGENACMLGCLKILSIQSKAGYHSAKPDDYIKLQKW